MSWLSKLFEKKKKGAAVPAIAVNGVLDALRRGKCPDCGSTAFYEGPSGGINTNYTCAGCGSTFNIGRAFSGSVFYAERI